MKEISSNFSKLSNEVVSQIKNDQGKYKQLRADVEREGIKVKRKVIENGEEKIIEKGEFYDLEKFEEEIKKESNLGIEIEDILSGFSVIAHQGVFGDAFNSMNSDDFKRDIVMKHVYPEGSDYRPNDNSEISIGSSAFNITFIIDETDLKNGKKAYLEMNSPIIDRFGKAMMDDAKTATIGNLIYTFNLKEQTFQLKITSNNPNLEQEQLGKILEFSSINNYLFKSDEEKLQDMLMGVIAELKGNLVQYRYNSAIDEKDLNNVANDAVNTIKRYLKEDFNVSDSNFELLETQLKSQVEKSVMELNEEVNLILKKNKLDANSILDDLFRETVKDITTTQNIVKSCISKIDFFAKEGTSEEVINQLKEQSLEQIEKNGISKDSLKNIEELVNPHLKEGRSFQLMIKDAINEQAIPVFKQKLFTSLDKSFNKMLKNESNEKVAQNASMLDIIKEFFASILESISSLFKDKELNAANTLTNAIKSTVDEARINQIQDKDKTNVEKFTQSRNEESAAIHR